MNLAEIHRATAAHEYYEDNNYYWHPSTSTLWICVSDAFGEGENTPYEEMLRDLSALPDVARVLTGDEWGPATNADENPNDDTNPTLGAIPLSGWQRL